MNTPAPPNQDPSILPSGGMGITIGKVEQFQRKIGSKKEGEVAGIFDYSNVIWKKDSWAAGDDHSSSLSRAPCRLSAFKCGGLKGSNQPRSLSTS